MSRQSDEKRELLKLKQGLIEESDIIEENKHEVTEKPRGFKRIEDFMYRNKWYFFMAVFFIAVGVFLIYQTFSREAADLTVMLVTSNTENTPNFYQKQHDLELALEQYCPDYDNNGNIHVAVYFIDLTKTGGDTQYTMSNDAKFYGEIERGVAELFICDDKIFTNGGDDKTAKENFENMFIDVGKITGDGQYSGQYMIKLKDTALAAEAKWESSCPEVLGLCVRREEEGMISYSENSLKNNERAQEVFNNIISGNRLHEIKTEE